MPSICLRLPNSDHSVRTAGSATAATVKAQTQGSFPALVSVTSGSNLCQLSLGPLLLRAPLRAEKCHLSSSALSLLQDASPETSHSCCTGSCRALPMCALLGTCLLAAHHRSFPARRGFTSKERAIAPPAPYIRTCAGPVLYIAKQKGSEGCAACHNTQLKGSPVQMKQAASQGPGLVSKGFPCLLAE